MAIVSSAPNHTQGAILAHELPCILFQLHAMGVMWLYEEGEGIEGLHCGLHSDYIVSRESSFGDLWAIIFNLLIIDQLY